MRTVLIIVEIVAAIYGVYNELAPSDWPLVELPPGAGASVALVALAMLPHLLDEKKRNKQILTALSLADKLIHDGGLARAMHESEFFEVWPKQLLDAQRNVDITNLKTDNPALAAGTNEKAYFKEFRRNVKACKARVRRVDAGTKAKASWISDLLREMQSVRNFSLAVYPEIQNRDSPISVCRVDSKVGWIVALVEHESTSQCRDLMVTDPRAVDLLARYFQERLWTNSITLMENGELTELGRDYLKKHG